MISLEQSLPLYKLLQLAYFKTYDSKATVWLKITESINY